jgi:hypothetical protein
MGLLVVIAYRNSGEWLTTGDFIREAAKDGVSLTPGQIAVRLQMLSGNAPMIKKAFQRNELTRIKLSVSVKNKSGIPRQTIYAYTFNPRGTVKITGALGFARVENLSKAAFVGVSFTKRNEEEE